MAPVVGRGTKCCGSMPRCRTCPARLSAEIRALLPEGGDDHHLAGVPACLHKYEPLFRARGEAAEAAPAPARPA